MRLGRDTVTVLRATLTTNRYGQSTRDWANASSVAVITNAHVQPYTMGENPGVDREWAASRLKLYVPPGTDVREHDRVSWRSNDYDVDGPPKVWRDVDGRLRHTQAIIKRISG